MVRILIVESHPIVRAALARILQADPNFEICGEVDTVISGLEAVERLKPDLVVTEVLFKSGSGFNFIRSVRRRRRAPRILVFTSYGEDWFKDQVLRAGAAAFLAKDAGSEEILETVRDIVRNPSGAGRQPTPGAAFLTSEEITERGALASLSSRELEVFSLIGYGLATSEIAARLNVSPKTVESHRERLKKKLQIKNGAALSSAATAWMLQLSSTASGV